MLGKWKDLHDQSQEEARQKERKEEPETEEERMRKLEEWRAEQEQRGGDSDDNANFIPVAENWRDRIAKKAVVKR